MLTEDVSRVELRPNDFDWAGHLNNSVHPQLLEVGRWRWGMTNGVDLRDGTLVAVVVSLHLDYLRSITWDPLGHVLVRTAFATSTTFSFTLRQDIECPPGTVAARATVRLALMDRQTQRPCRTDLISLLAGDRLAGNGAGT